MDISFLLYPTRSVKVDEDSSFWIIHELLQRGHTVSHFQSGDLFWEGGRLQAYLTAAKTDPKKGFLPSPRPRRPSPLDSLDVIFIRKEPPFDAEYLACLQLLSRLKKPFILNDPAGMMLCNEKLSVLDFPGFAPECLVTGDALEARRFARRFRLGVVVKPLDNKAGSGVFRVRHDEKHFPARLESATEGGRRKVMLQRYLPHGASGDKRILLLGGRCIGSFLRVPPKTDFRANLSLGGSMRRSGLSRREEKLIGEMRPHLSKYGLYFVGLDVIDGFLSEVNVTSPSGIPELRALEGKRAEKDVASFIEERLEGL